MLHFKPFSKYMWRVINSPFFSSRLPALSSLGFSFQGTADHIFFIANAASWQNSVAACVEFRNYLDSFSTVWRLCKNSLIHRRSFIIVPCILWYSSGWREWNPHIISICHFFIFELNTLRQDERNASSNVTSIPPCGLSTCAVQKVNRIAFTSLTTRCSESKFQLLLHWCPEFWGHRWVFAATLLT